MTLREKCAQALMTSIDGTESFPPHLYTHFKDIVPGAVILFSRNIADTPDGVHSYILSCKRAFADLGSDIPVIFAVDNEGGDVFRTGRVTSRLPSARAIATGLNPDRAKALYGLAGSQLAGLGLSMNIAPVAETGDRSHDFMGMRTFSDDPEIVSRYSIAAIRGYRQAGVIPVAKHFPGNSGDDPHQGISRLDDSRENLDRVRSAPFRSLIAEGLPAILVTHNIVRSLDSGSPFCLSRRCVTGYLREFLGFDGLVLTDDISMEALTKAAACSPGEAAIRAIQAGCDMIMTSDPDIRPIVSVIEDRSKSDPAFASQLDRAVERILMCKLQFGLLKTPLRRLADSRSPKSMYKPFDSDTYEKDRNSANEILEEMQ